MIHASAKASLGERLQALAVLGLAPTVALLSASPSTTWASLTSSAQVPTGPLVALVALGAWLCTGWLLLVVASTTAGRLPGLAGYAARRTAARLAPASVRALVRVALGTTVALTVLSGTSSAFADDRPVIARSFDWPGLSVQPAPGPTLDWPSATPSSTPAPVRSVSPDPVRVRLVPPATAAPDPVRAGVVVHAGDSLWSIAARDLGPQATPDQVAQAWPRWWSANRTSLGDHPELIHPGDHLSRPTTR